MNTPTQPAPAKRTPLSVKHGHATCKQAVAYSTDTALDAAPLPVSLQFANRLASEADELRAQNADLLAALEEIASEQYAYPADIARAAIARATGNS